MIGAIDGVEETEAGFLQGREVTLLRYDSQIVSIEEVYQIAASHGAGDKVYTDLNGYRKAPLRDQKRQIQGTAFSRIEMTNAQSTKVNAWVRTDTKKALDYLTAEQIRAMKLEP